MARCDRLPVALGILVLFTLCLTRPVASDDRPAVDAAPAAASRFTYVDLSIDPRGQPLAAWQVEFAAERGDVSLVGVEAGEHPAYAKRPAYYDPAALKGRRIIVGDFSLDPALPRARTRVCRLMLEVRGDARPEFVAKLMTAADPDGHKIDSATVDARQAPAPAGG